MAARAVPLRITLWCIFYLVGVWYLTKPAVKALFVPDVRSESDGPGEPQLR